MGATTIGNVSARPRADLAQVVARVDGDLAKLRDPGLTNVARFVFTLGRSAVRDNGTEIAPEVHHLRVRTPRHWPPLRILRYSSRRRPARHH
ncbi:hypothetical protein [Amycolatopsis jejuensis]|uniref:hypothetical protein n=1 Tax=Amycolatopsis jejuensis TaxID=330084 RepID=UPI000527B39B|nr:hypothetical protein [Amycolatopsis jejuensis]